MRIPFDDLTRPKAVAKHLAALSANLKLSAAQEATARASGYRDWHELSASLSAMAVAQAAPNDQDVAVVAGLADALGLDDGEVQDAVAKTKLVDGQAWTAERHQACRESLRRERGRLTKVQIERGKAAASYDLPPFHEHDDCIRIAYEWLDSQVKTKGLTTSTKPLKHIIEKWAGRYVSTTDVVVAAKMHPDIRGTYPHFNISARLTEPSRRRLEGISEAFKQDYHERFDPKAYARQEA